MMRLLRFSIRLRQGSHAVVHRRVSEFFVISEELLWTNITTSYELCNSLVNSDSRDYMCLDLTTKHFLTSISMET